MRSRLPGLLVLLMLALAGVAGWFLLPHKAGRVETLTLTPVSFGELPGWNQGNPRAALAAFRRSCAMVLKQAPGTELGAYAGRAADWQPVCRASLTADESNARAFFANNFVAEEAGGHGLFTGYYEPLLQGSRTRHDAYQTPVYALPGDLISADLGLFRPEWKGERLAGRLTGQHLVPYAGRAEIDAKPPAAAVLFYGDDPVSVFFLHIQGSGRVMLDDGSIIRVAYAGQNGRPYTPIGRTLIRSGALPRENVSMQTIRAWLKSNPAAARQVMESDESFVFFKESPVGDPSLGSAGAEGVALTPMASTAVDLRFHVLGVPVFIATTTPDGHALQNLFVAQDTGGAIRGPVRADIFFGFGAKAESLAGGMKSSGQLYVLLPKSLAARVAP
ncbi:MAG: murein transglycosylase A [Rhizomicrobium sp.]